MQSLPTICPKCGSTDTGEKDYSAYECYDCEAYWYWTNPAKRDHYEVVSGETRQAAQSAFDDAADRYYGLDGGW